MIKINSFTPLDNFTRRSWEFFDDHMVIRTKSLTLDYENEVEYRNIKFIRSKRMIDLNWMWASFVAVGLLGLTSLGLGWFNIHIPNFVVVEKIVVVFALVMLFPAFRSHEYYSFVDADWSSSVTIRVNNKNKLLILDAIDLIKHKTEITVESYYTNSFPSESEIYQHKELDIPDFLNHIRVRFYKDKLVAVEKSLAEEITTVIKYDQFSGKTKFAKVGNDKWDYVWSCWLFFLCIVGITTTTFFGKQMKGNYLLLNLFYIGLGLLIPLHFFRYIKSEILVFYDKKDNGIFWMNINSANREKLTQIAKFIKGKVEFQN